METFGFESTQQKSPHLKMALLQQQVQCPGPFSRPLAVQPPNSSIRYCKVTENAFRGYGLVEGDLTLTRLPETPANPALDTYVGLRVANGTSSTVLRYIHIPNIPAATITTLLTRLHRSPTAQDISLDGTRPEVVMMINGSDTELVRDLLEEVIGNSSNLSGAIEIRNALQRFWQSSQELSRLPMPMSTSQNIGNTFLEYGKYLLGGLAVGFTMAAGAALFKWLQDRKNPPSGGDGTGGGGNVFNFHYHAQTPSRENPGIRIRPAQMTTSRLWQESIGPTLNRVRTVASEGAVGVGLSLVTAACVAGGVVLLMDDSTGVGVLDDALIPFLARAAAYTGLRSATAFSAASLAWVGR